MKCFKCGKQIKGRVVEHSEAGFIELVDFKGVPKVNRMTDGGVTIDFYCKGCFSEDFLPED